MAEIQARGYVNKPETKMSKGGHAYNKFTLAVKQKRKGPDGVVIEEKIYLNCLDFSGGSCPDESSYTGVKGYLTVSTYDRNGKTGVNLDVTVKEYEELEQLAPKGKANGSSGGAKRGDGLPPADPFELKPDADLGT